MRLKTLHPFLMRTAATLTVLMLTMMAFPSEAKAQTIVSSWGDLKSAAEAATTTTPKNIKLVGNITRNASEEIEVTGMVTLDLNGHTIDGGGDSYLRTCIFHVDSSGELTITDLTDKKGGKICGAKDVANIYIGGIYNADAPYKPGKVTLAAGTIGGPNIGVALGENGSFTMTGGTINTEDYIVGTGVYLDGSSSFTMSGGTITGNYIGVDIRSDAYTDTPLPTMTVSGNVNISGNARDVNLVYESGAFNPIYIGGDLSANARIGVWADYELVGTNAKGKTFASGLRGKVSALNFFINECDALKDLIILAKDIDGNGNSQPDRTELYFAQADKHLYLDGISGTTATLKCCGDYSEKNYFLDGVWVSNDYSGFDVFKSSCTEITVDNSCMGFNGDKLSSLFNGWSALTTLDLSSFNTASVTNMNSMFSGCSNLATIYVGENWSTASVTNSTGMFSGCTSLPNYNGSEVDKTHANDGTDGYLNKVKVTAHEGATGEFWATFYNKDKHFIAPTGTQVFKVNLDGTALTMTEIADRIVTSGKGVVLKTTTSGTGIISIVLDVYSAASADNYSGNSLVGTMTSITNPGNAYVLNKKEAGIGFYKLSASGTIGANKAYLIYDENAGSREFFSFDDTTGMNDAMRLNDNVEMTNDNVYDLQGRRVSNPSKGIYIVNGKKVVIK